MSSERPVTIPDLIRKAREFADDNMLDLAELILVSRTGKQIPLEISALREKRAEMRETHANARAARGQISTKLLKVVWNALPSNDQPGVDRKIVPRLADRKSKSDVYKALHVLVGMGKAVQDGEGRYHKAAKKKSA